MRVTAPQFCISISNTLPKAGAEGEAMNVHEGQEWARSELWENESEPPHPAWLCVWSIKGSSSALQQH